MDDVFPGSTKVEMPKIVGGIDALNYPEAFYKPLKDIKDKCYDPSHPKYPYYGGVGIHVCNRWLINFRKFREDMSPKERSTGIRRLNKEDDFHPGNCYWGRTPRPPRPKIDKRKALSSIGKYKFNTDWLVEFEDWEKFRFVYKRVVSLGIPDDNIILAKKYITHLYNDPRFSMLYDNWIKSGKELNKIPSIDHMIPISKGGTNNLWNLNWVTFFENRAKGSTPQEEWDYIKNNLSEYFL